MIVWASRRDAGIGVHALVPSSFGGLRMLQRVASAPVAAAEQRLAPPGEHAHPIGVEPRRRRPDCVVGEPAGLWFHLSRSVTDRPHRRLRQGRICRAELFRSYESVHAVGGVQYLVICLRRPRAGHQRHMCNRLWVFAGWGAGVGGAWCTCRSAGPSRTWLVSWQLLLVICCTTSLRRVSVWFRSSSAGFDAGSRVVFNATLRGLQATSRFLRSCSSWSTA